MESDKYNIFINLLNFFKNKYETEKLFKDFVSLFAISLSNKVCFNEENNELYNKIYQSYDKEERYIFYSLSAELTKLFCNEDEPYDVLGEIYNKISNKKYLKVQSENRMQKIGKELQGLLLLNNKLNNGKMLEVNCGSGGMILAYASVLKMFKLNYKIDLEVTATDTNIINVFMTYIQLYFFDIAATVILLDEQSNNELMRLYTTTSEDDLEEMMIA